MSSDALRSLVLAYARAVDARDVAGLVALFEPDAVMTVHQGNSGASFHGESELPGIVDAVSGFASTDHVIGEASFVIDGDTAAGVVEGVAHHFDNSGTDLVLMLNYDDAYRFGDGEWRFAARTLRLSRPTSG